MEIFTLHMHRDAWKSVEGTSKEDAHAKYVERLLEVSDKHHDLVQLTYCVTCAQRFLASLKMRM